MKEQWQRYYLKNGYIGVSEFLGLLDENIVLYHDKVLGKWYIELTFNALQRFLNKMRLYNEQHASQLEIIIYYPDNEESEIEFVYKLLDVETLMEWGNGDTKGSIKTVKETQTGFSNN